MFCVVRDLANRLLEQNADYKVTRITIGYLTVENVVKEINSTNVAI